MTTMTITKGLNLQAVVELAQVMASREVYHIFPNKHEGEFHNGAIDEMILDEDGNAFLLIEGQEAVMLPALV